MENILKRIEKIAVNEGIKIGALERSIGASKGVLSRALSNGTDIQSKWIQVIVEKYYQYSPEWLLTGRGEMIREESTHASLPTATPSASGIPLIPLEAIAGFSIEDNQGITLKDCQLYSIPEFEAKGADFLIRVSGNSMAPIYHNGDIIACRKIKNILFFQWGEIYVIDTSQGVIVKYVEECTNNEENIICVSENKHYKPFQIPKTDIRSLSTIIGLVRLV